jgi:hypothetical protein
MHLWRMFASDHSGCSAACECFLNSICIRNYRWLLKTELVKNGICCNDFTLETLVCNKSQKLFIDHVIFILKTKVLGLFFQIVLIQ